VQVKSVLQLLIQQPHPQEKSNREISLSPASCAWTLARGIRIRRCSTARDGTRHFLPVSRDGLFQLLRLRLLGRGRVPVVYNLAEEDSVEREASDEAVEDERVVDFLESCKDTR